MSILDVFTILIKSNAKDTEKDFDSLDKKTKQTQETIGKTSEKTKDLGLNFGDLVKAIVTASGIDFSIKGLANATVGIVGMEVGLGRLSKLTGVQANDISAWDAAVQRFSGGSAGDFEGWLNRTSDKYIELGQGDKIKNILPSLLRLADQWKDLDFYQKEFFARQFELTPDMVIAMDKGGAALQDMVDQQKQLLSVTDEDTKAALELADAWNNVKRAITGAIAEALLHPHKFFLEQPSGGASFDVPNWLGQYIPDWFKVKKPGATSASGDSHRGNAQMLALISQYETGNQNVPNASGPGGTPASTASGYYQIINGTWRQFAPQAGVSLDQYPTAMSAPLDVQTKVASLIYDKQGIAPWASDARLMAAVAANGISAADGSSLNGMPASSNKTTNVSIGDITIHTQATDAHGIANDLGNHLSSQLRNTVGSFDDSIVR